MASTSGATPGDWTWDANRSQYFYWSPHESCFVYQNGLKIDANGREIAQPLSPQSPRSAQVPTPDEFIAAGQPAHARGDSSSTDLSYHMSGLTVSGLGSSTYGAHTSPGAYPAGTASAGSQGYQMAMWHNQAAGAASVSSQSTANYAWPNQAAGTHASAYNTAQVGTGNQASNYAYQHGNTSGHQQQQQQQQQHQQQGYGATLSGQNSDGVQRNFELGNPQSITDTALQSEGVYARSRINATKGTKEKLDPRFQRRKGPQFFKIGKVFKMLWPELASDTTVGLTTYTASFEQSIFTKIRWFVVIREGTNYCSCLPIQTYTGRGVSKPGVEKHHHAIIFTGKKEPKAKPEESPRQGEYGMRSSIKAKANHQGDKMDPMSRLNFAKIHTVEHNVKVYDFGKVDDADLHKLTSTFRLVWKLDVPEEGGDGDDDDDDDDDEDGEEEEDDDDNDAADGEEGGEDDNT